MGSSSSRVQFASEKVIDRLLDNVDVWQVVFEMLPVKDRIRLEMTNKRLGMLMFTCWKRVSSFDSKKFDNRSMNEKRWEALIAICMNQIGDGLRSLTIREKYPSTVCSDHLPSIGEGCPNIETINFLFKDKDGIFHHIRFDSFSRLKTITVSTPGGNFTRASASLFLSIPTSIEVIRGLGGMKELPFENGAQLEGFFADRPSLKEIYLGPLFTRDKSKADMFRVIAQRCPHLKSIRLASRNGCIDHSGVIALESMKELRLYDAFFDEMDIVTICERSHLVEAIELTCRISSDLQSTALNALGALTKLRELTFFTSYKFHVEPLWRRWYTEFVRDLARNSGASLGWLDLPNEMPLPTAAIEALANGCAKLRHVRFYVRVGEAEPASIRFLIDCIVAHPSWIPQTSQLVIKFWIIEDGVNDHEAEAGRAAFKALADPAANLPAGVELNIWRVNRCHGLSHIA